MRAHLRTLTPLHVGNGEKINALTYVLDKRIHPEMVCVFDFAGFRDALGPDHLHRFASWINQAQAQRPTCYGFLQREIQEQNFEFTNRLQERARYRIPNLSDENLQAEVDCVIKNADDRIYIPGSEIKGAMRTALLYARMEGEPSLYENLRKKIETFKKRFSKKLIAVKDRQAGRKEQKIKRELIREMGKIEAALQQQAFRSREDAQFDVLRLLFVSDSNASRPEDILFIGNVEMVGIEQRFGLYHELVFPRQTFLCDLEVDGKKEMREKLMFTEDQQALVTDVTAVFQACHRFSKRLIEAEIRYFSEAGSDSRSSVDLLERIREINSPERPAIRIGKNEGYLSLTVGMLLRERDPDLYQDVVVHATKNTSYSSSFPKTRRVVTDTAGVRWPLGWIQVSPDDAFSDAGMPEFQIRRKDRQSAPYRSRDREFSSEARLGQKTTGTSSQRPTRSASPPPAAGPAPEAAPRSTGRERVTMREAKKAVRQARAQPQRAVREGMRVNAEVVSNDGRTVVVRLTDAQNEEVSFQQPAYPQKPGDRVKVRVQRVDANGRVTRVVP